LPAAYGQKIQIALAQLLRSVQQLRHRIFGRFFDISVLFYNPNIQPEAEYSRRLSAQRSLLDEMRGSGALDLIDEGWRGEDFISAARGLETDPKAESAAQPALSCALKRRPGKQERAASTIRGRRSREPSQGRGKDKQTR
jgi:hypothetical protein